MSDKKNNSIGDVNGKVIIDNNYINWLKKFIKKENGYFSSLSFHFSQSRRTTELDEQKVDLLNHLFELIEKVVVERSKTLLPDRADRSYYIRHGKDCYKIGKEYIGGINNYYCQDCSKAGIKDYVDFNDIIFYETLEANSANQKKLDKLECIVRDMIIVDKIPPMVILDVIQKYVNKET